MRFSARDAERHAVAVGGGQAQAGQLVAPVAVALARAGHDDVVLERARRARVADLRVEVGADAAGALAVEEGDVDNAQMPTILVDPQPRTMDAMLDAATRARLDALGDVVVHEGAGRMPDDGRRGPPRRHRRHRRPDRPRRRAHRPRPAAAGGRSTSRATSCATSTTRPASRAGSTCSWPAPRSPRPWPRPRSAWPSTSRAASPRPTAPCAPAPRPTSSRPTAAASCSPAATSASSGSATSGASSCACSRPFRCRVRAYDPWLPELAIRAAGAEPAGLDELLRRVARRLRLRRAHDRQPGDARPARARARCRTAPRCSS